ncbi:MAG TPA: hypothetical protein VEX86_01885 [Longimicrobium sp.]|nr:hypothetical protein [Longimicrobium sp.]
MERNSQGRRPDPAQGDRNSRPETAFTRRIDCGAEPRGMAAAPAEGRDGARGAPGEGA